MPWDAVTVMELRTGLVTDLTVRGVVLSLDGVGRLQPGAAKARAVTTGNPGGRGPPER